MQRYSKQRSKKVAQPPGSLIHIGDKKRENIQIKFIEYTEESILEKECDIKDIYLLDKESAAVRWIRVNGIHDIKVIEGLGNHFGIHHLVLEDILNTEQRPKIEDHGEYIYIVVKKLSFNSNLNEFTTEQESIILSHNFVITFSEGTDIYNPVHDWLINSVGKIRRLGADYLAYTLLDVITDNYFIVLEELGEKIEYTEDEMVMHPSNDTLKSIQKLKRQILFLHKSVWPLREVVGFMERGNTSLLKDSTNIYIRDLYDHVIQVMDTTETFRDILSEILDIYLSSVSNKMNEIMKVLTIISTVFIPLSFIVGLYGMNLKNMPEYEWPWMYPVVWIIIISVATIMLAFFKKKKWW